ncbi:putative indole-3-acetic acid-amido synthetase GH3.1 [Acorus calamus]|uniref:Indole-3-acetic acid-amido synthetase GH3.1 n=1 Tax=Acorus calamus TaxID=4465 RepID=A0AAV9CGW5_ACOCL|nr:putative indole-3-acetic acid-amido synthetase GH3.1 [Acorus calamus]
MSMMNAHMPGLDKGNGMYFFFVKLEARTPGGLIYYKSKFFYDHPTDADPYNIHNSLTEVVLCPDSY